MFKWLTKFVEEEHETTRLLVKDVRERMNHVHHLVHNGIMDSNLHRRFLEDIKKTLAELTEADEESRLGPMMYEIEANDLYLLSKRDRMFVFHAGIVCFNDICPVRLSGVTNCGKVSIDRIMAWKRACVMSITEAQVNEAIDEQQK